MDEKVLLDWKEAHADVYSKFKQDLEEQLLKPYHQTILDLGDGNAESLQSVIAHFAAISTEDGFDIDKLYIFITFNIFKLYRVNIQTMLLFCG
jgi:hypothetical protein